MDKAQDLRRNVRQRSSARLAVCIFGEVLRSGLPNKVVPFDTSYEGLVEMEMGGCVRSIGFFPYGVFLMPWLMTAVVVIMVGGWEMQPTMQADEENWLLDDLRHGERVLLDMVSPIPI